MIFIINLAESLLNEVSIELCGRNIDMAEHLLDRSKISAVFKQMDRKRVPESMWSDLFVYMRRLLIVLEIFQNPCLVILFRLNWTKQSVSAD